MLTSGSENGMTAQARPQRASEPLPRLRRVPERLRRLSAPAAAAIDGIPASNSPAAITATP